MTIIETRSLTKKYGSHLALNELNIQINSGSLTAYLGTNGAGKSTTIRMLTQTLTPTSGEILYNGSTENKDIKIGVVFQNSILDKELTVLDNLLLRAAMYKKVNKKRLFNLMEKTGVLAFAKKKYGKLSGGMKRKVDITRALINEPEFLFLDEPTTGLDPKSRKEIWYLLNELKLTENIGIFLTTHYLEEAENADHVYIIEKGNLLESGTAKSLKEKYANPVIWLSVKNRELLLADISKAQIIGEDNRGIGINHSTVADVLMLLEKQRQNIIDFSYQPIEMNEVFLKVTGRGFNNESNY